VSAYGLVLYTYPVAVGALCDLHSLGLGSYDENRRTCCVPMPVGGITIDAALRLVVGSNFAATPLGPVVSCGKIPTTIAAA